MNRIGIFLLSSMLLLNCVQKPESEKPLPSMQRQVVPTATSNSVISDDDDNSEDEIVSISKSRQNAITTAVEKASPAIVSITVTELERGYTREFDPSYFRFFLSPVEREVQSMGSGFIISEDGLVVTNAHVAGESAKKIMVVLADATKYDAELIGSDALADLSLLKIVPKDSTQKFPFVEFDQNKNAIVGEWAIAMGNPFGLFDDGRPSVTVGVVSATQRDFRPDPNDPHVYIDMIQTDAAINRGNSGGPLINSNGEVIGVNTFIFTGGTSSGFVGLGFAIPSTRTQQIIKQLMESGKVSLEFDPGMEIVPMTRNLVFQYNLPTIPGLFVTKVNKSGPAFQGGIMPGDIIVKIGGVRVSSEMHAWALMREYKEGSEMNIELVRAGNSYEAKITLRKRVMGR
ncbi:MAG: trypsin-like peptidase domain-containing protein [Balneolaceae bacterium]